MLVLGGGEGVELGSSFLVDCAAWGMARGRGSSLRLSGVGCSGSVRRKSDCAAVALYFSACWRFFMFFFVSSVLARVLGVLFVSCRVRSVALGKGEGRRGGKGEVTRRDPNEISRRLDIF